MRARSSFAPRRRNPRLSSRTAVAAGAAMALGVLAGCADDHPATSDVGDGQPVATVAGGVEPPRPVSVSVGWSAAMTSATRSYMPVEGDESAAVNDAARDTKLAPWVQYHFVADPALGEGTGEAFGWRYPEGTAVDPARVAELAAVLGVSGEPVAISAEAGGGWRVGPEDGSAPMVAVSGDAVGSWYYQAAWVDQAAEPACVVPAEAARGLPADDGVAASEPAVVDPDTPVEAPAPETGTAVEPTVDPTTQPVCPEPEPPAGVPTEEEARALGEGLLTQLGYDLASVDVQVSADEWFATYNATLRFEGVPSYVSVGFGWGGDAQLTWASGVFNSPVQVGPYPLAGTARAVERLNEMFAYSAEPAIDTIDPAAAAEPEGSVPQPEIQDMPLVSFEPALEWVWEPNGDVWLLPAYRFTAADGSQYSAIAVTDEYIITVDPDTVTEPVPAEEGEAGQGAAGSSGSAALPPELQIPAEGVDPDEYAAIAKEAGFEMRVVETDGVPAVVTADFREDRVNVTIVDGLVVSAYIG